jgi:hypothetical protein
MDILRFCLDVFWKMKGVRRALVTIQSLSTIKKALVLLIFNGMSPCEVSTTALSIQTLSAPGYKLEPLP